MHNDYCDHCKKPISGDEHVGGPADGSFICHFEPWELPEGQSYCDCWKCEELWVKIFDELDAGVEWRRKLWELLGGER
jgi:hypothetical protein